MLRRFILSSSERTRFERTFLPYQGAAYNLARWLTQNDHDAEDVVQDAYVRAFQAFGGFQGGDHRSWLLRIVRNTCYTWLKKNRGKVIVPLDEGTQTIEDDRLGPEAQIMQRIDQDLLRQALEDLPLEFREVIVLRELEGFSYKEIAAIINAPLGTAMSRLARARARLISCVTRRKTEEEAVS